LPFREEISSLPLGCLLRDSLPPPAEKGNKGASCPEEGSKENRSGKHQFWLFTVSITRKNILYRLYLAKVNAAASEPSDKK